MKIRTRYTSPKRWKPLLALVLALLASALYFVRWEMYSTPSMRSEMERFFIGDLAFLALQILVVTVFLETYLKRRENLALREKLNMIVGAFFSETGFELLGDIIKSDVNAPQIAEAISPQLNWTNKDFERARILFEQHDVDIRPTPEQLEVIRDLLCTKKQSLLALLTNQALLDHEAFTDLLWSISHLGDELMARTNFAQLPQSDIAHLGKDLERTYAILGIEWLNYLEHLQKRYPYLYSLAVRNNPLNPYCVVEVLE